MTTNREAMTLEQVRDWHRERAQDGRDYVDSYPEVHNAMADAIDAHLRAAEPVVWIIEHDNWYHGSVTVRRLSGGGLSFHVLNDAEAQSLCALLNAAARALRTLRIEG